MLFIRVLGMLSFGVCVFGLRGSCPPALPVSVCTAECTAPAPASATAPAASGCPAPQLCCPTACGGAVCTRPVTQRRLTKLVKPGSCPATPGGVWVCSHTCTSDSDCPRKLKCCANRCGAMVCTRPEFSQQSNQTGLQNYPLPENTPVSNMNPVHENIHNDATITNPEMRTSARTGNDENARNDSNSMNISLSNSTEGNINNISNITVERNPSEGTNYYRNLMIKPEVQPGNHNEPTADITQPASPGGLPIDAKVQPGNENRHPIIDNQPSSNINSPGFEKPVIISSHDPLNDQPSSNTNEFVNTGNNHKDQYLPVNSESESNGRALQSETQPLFQISHPVNHQALLRREDPMPVYNHPDYSTEFSFGGYQPQYSNVQLQSNNQRVAYN